MSKSISHYIKILKRRIYRRVKYSNFHYFLDYKRVLTKEFLEKIDPIDNNHYEVGNYFLHKNYQFNKTSLIYSFGILNDIDFDLALVNNSKCQVYLFDPTPRSIAFMKTYKDHPQLHYTPKGLWTEKTVLKFFQDPEGGSASAVFNTNSGSYFEANCETLDQLMSHNKHQHIDVLKMDIEGAALPVLEYMIKKDIYPTQIVVELERPKKTVTDLIDFFFRVNQITTHFQQKNYSIFKLPKDRAKYFSLELLFVKN